MVFNGMGKLIHYGPLLELMERVLTGIVRR